MRPRIRSWSLFLLAALSEETLCFLNGPNFLVRQVPSKTVRPFWRQDGRIFAIPSILNEGDEEPERVRRRRRFQRRNKEWLKHATSHFVQTKPGSLTVGKWNEVISIFTAWSAYAKYDYEAPLQMEALLKVLVEERRAGNESVELSMELYNLLLDTWACAALFRTGPVEQASQRSRELLVMLQENYEQELASVGGDEAAVSAPKPDEESFDVVLHVVCRTEGALVARRLLAWMEFLHKSGRNVGAKPTRSDYIQVLDAYAKQGINPGQLAEGFLRHLKCTARHLQLPDTLCYNIAIKAWMNESKLNRRAGCRQAAEHADRIMEEMKQAGNESCRPDLVTYSSTIAAWATSGMKAHAVARAEELLREIEESRDMEANTVVLNSVMSAWVKSRDPAAVNRTEEILNYMEASGDTAPPDLIAYNTHLHALSMHAFHRPDLARRADDLLRRMEEGCDSRQLTFGPNVFTYNLVLEAICRAQPYDPSSAKGAASILRKLVKREGVEPDTFSFNQVLAALSRSSAKGSARTAEELLEYMEESYRTGVHPYAKPNEISYASVIVSYARSGEKGAVFSAEMLLEKMKHRYTVEGDVTCKPSRVCYNALIDCWAKSGEGTLGARKAEALLQEMQHQFEAGDASMAPDLMTFNSVLNAWARSGTRCCGVQAEKYLDQMWELYHSGDVKVKPNEVSYNTVINAISKSKNEGKAQKALRILRRMDISYQAGNNDARPNEITYTAVLNSCAFPAVLDPLTRRKALDTAIFTMEELRESQYGRPNHVTYGTFIRACANLLDDDDDLRRSVIKRAFRRACEDGQVGPMVLNSTPRDMYEELFADYIQSGARVTFQDLPAEWRCNVQERKTRRRAVWHSRARKQTPQEHRRNMLKP